MVAFGPSRRLPGGQWGHGRIEGHPLTADISSPFGPRDPIDLPDGRVTSGFHTGVDLPADPGTPILAPAAGEVVEQASNLSFGNWVVLRHDDGGATKYAHMRAGQPMAGRGMRLRRGDIIGFVGTTGLSTGPHLHWEYMPHYGLTGVGDPIPLLAETIDDPAPTAATPLPTGFRAETRALLEMVRILRESPIAYDAALGAIEREADQMIAALERAA